MTTNDKIEIMTAYLNGMRIQERKVSISDEPWKDVDYEPIWDWYKKEYRVKPEIEDDDPILMTNRQLSKWIAKGFGEWKLIDDKYVSSGRIYSDEHKNLSVKEDVLIRSWDSDEWVKPTVDIYMRDCKLYCRTPLA